ncbi:hypothetical protein HYQ44_002740 [Verticillium longisporum]|nr:hypothetical protein HYQ44_002740 [Verticillium longisporum]
MLNAFMRPTCNPLFSTGIISNSVNLTWLPTDYDRQELNHTVTNTVAASDLEATQPTYCSRTDLSAKYPHAVPFRDAYPVEGRKLAKARQMPG